MKIPNSCYCMMISCCQGSQDHTPGTCSSLWRLSMETDESRQAAGSLKSASPACAPDLWCVCVVVGVCVAGAKGAILEGAEGKCRRNESFYHSSPLFDFEK